MNFTQLLDSGQTPARLSRAVSLKTPERTLFKGVLMRIHLLILLLAVFCTQVSATAFGQKITLRENRASLSSLFSKIEKQSGYTFFYNKRDIVSIKPISITVNNASLEEALNKIFAGQPCNYEIQDKIIVLNKRPPLPAKAASIAAQSDVTGTVNSSDGGPLEGVSVLVKGTQRGTVTNAAGRYQIPAKAGEVLVFRNVGYAGQEAVVGQQGTINIVLVPESSDLDEVVVVGYGSMERKDLTGSVASVKSAQIKDLAVTRIDQALAGRAAGVQVKAANGEPGSAPQIRIRGIGSISAGADPLYVVDGFPVGDIQTLNPNDIESLDVLKDASATAIYGSRGSNGVIIITTKRGKAGNASIGFNTYYGVQNILKRPDFMNVRDQAQYGYDGFRNKNIDNGSDVSGDPSTWDFRVPQTILDVLSGKNTTNVDALDAVLRTAPQAQYELTASGGNENVKYALSGEYLDQQGGIRNSDFKRYSLRANIDGQLTKKLSVKMSLNPSFSDRNIVAASGSGGGTASLSTIGAATIAQPYYPLYDENGNYFNYANLDAQQNIWNPMAQVNEIQNKERSMRLLGNVSAEYSILDELKFNVLLGGSFINLKGMTFQPKLPAFLDNAAIGTDRAGMVYNWLTEYTLNYNKDFGKHRITGLAGFTSQKETSLSNNLESNRYPNNLVPTLSAVSGILTDGSSDTYQWSLISYLARANYVYDDKYYLTASIRTDGSSRFGSANKYGIFPSAAVAWRISNENFLKNVSFLSELKLRGSYGETGNNNIGNYEQYATINYEKYILGGGAVGGYIAGKLPNPLLTWEKQRQINLGVDVSLFNRRIGLTVDHFRSTNTDLLLNVNVPDITGFSTALQNIGEVKNTGWEFVLNTNNLNGSFSWSTDFNLSTYRNKVTKLGPEGDPIISGRNITMIGEPIGMFYGLLTDGIFMNQAELDAGPLYNPGGSDHSRLGDVRFVDVSGPNGTPDGVINSFDYTIMGSPYPDFYYGMTNTFSYKNVSLNIGIQGSQGSKVMSSALEGYIMTRSRNRSLTNQNDYWKSEQEPGDGKTPRPNDLPTGGNRLISQRFVDEGSYLRINNITLSYLFPQTISEKLTVNSLRLYLNATNPFIFTKNVSFNPDVSHSGNALTPGIDNNNYPLMKSLILGLNVTF